MSDSDSRNQTTKTTATHVHLPAWVLAVLRYVGPPVLLLLLIGTAIVGAKTWRRRRRRTRGLPATRLARGWREILDHARDLGRPLSGPATRREQAIELDGLDLGALALLTDRHVFGPDGVTDADADGFWSQVKLERKRMSRSVSRSRRWRAALSLASLLPHGRRHRVRLGLAGEQSS